MAFGPRMEIQRKQGPPIVLDAIAEEDLRQLPSIYSQESEPIRRYVTQKFIDEEASTLSTSNPTHYYEWRDAIDSTQWGIYAKHRKLSRYILVGNIGVNRIEFDLLHGWIGHSRMVIMNADFLGQGIGSAAATGRTYHEFHPNGDTLDRLHSRVDIRNTASYNVVYNQGYRCFNHTPPKGPLEPDFERHLLELPNPRLLSDDIPNLYHSGEDWETARLQTREILKHARQIIRPLLD